jgi:hypothetical protein
MGIAASVGGAVSGLVMTTTGYRPLAVGGALVSALLVPVAWMAGVTRLPRFRFWPLRCLPARE